MKVAMGLKLLTALLLVGLAHGEDQSVEYGEADIELNPGDGNIVSQVVENALKIESITANIHEGSNCFNEDGSPRYDHSNTTVWSYHGCHVTLTAVFSKQSTIICVELTAGKTDDEAEVSVIPDPDNGLPVGQIVSLEVVTLLSQRACIFKSTFWYKGNLIVTFKGCKAIFRICYLIVPNNMGVVRRIGGGTVMRKFEGRILVAVKVIFIFRTCTTHVFNEGVFVAVDCAGFFLFCFKPISLHCEIADDPKVAGFDGNFVNVREPCMYNAVAFTLSHFCYFEMSVKVKIDEITGVAFITFVRVVTKEIVITMDDKAVTVDGVIVVVTEEVTVIKHICFVRKLGFIEITLRCGIIIKWKGRLGMFKVWAPSCFSASVSGLCGNANWARVDDLIAPNGQFLLDFDDIEEGSREITLQHIVKDTSPEPSDLPQCIPKSDEGE